jgi:hypothetical protein
MAVFELQCRPIDKWPRAFTPNRKRAPFRAPYGATMDLIARELRLLCAKAPVLLMALNDQQIRLDGRPYAKAIPLHPGVILAFTVGKQQMQFPCDAFLTWPENLRAIALALEALRKVDRYGVTKQGEQYAGWKALPPPNGDHWTPEAARQFIDSIIGSGRVGLIGISASIREAEMVTHPDKGGHPSDFNKVQQARKLLLRTN